MSHPASATPAKRRRLNTNREEGGERWTKVHTVRFTVPNFLGITDGSFITPYQSCHNLKLRLLVCSISSDPDEPVEFNLLFYHFSAKEIKLVRAEFTYQIGSSTSQPYDVEYHANGRMGGSVQYDWLKRSEITPNHLDSHGNLLVNINIRLSKLITTWYPPKPDVNPALERLYDNLEIESDITFLVGDDDDGKEKFYAHKNILYCQAPTLYSLIEDHHDQTEDQTRLVEISDISSFVFEILLRHIYLGTLPNVDIDDDEDVRSTPKGAAIMSFAKDVLVAADRFNLISLKLHMESELTEMLLEPSTVGDLLLFADSYSCQLLKEASMDLYAQNIAAVKAADGWKQVKQSPDLLEEVLEYYGTIVNAGGKRKPKNRRDFANMSIGMLRTKLVARHSSESTSNLELILDGTRTMLIQKLMAKES